MNCQKLQTSISQTIELLIASLKSHQLNDGGFKGYHLFDNKSGIWSTCEIIHVLMKVNPKLKEDNWTLNAVKYIATNQNKDGGWGFRINGKSIVDVTAWACLALSHFDYEKEILEGVRFLITARKNSSGADNGGWGLTNFEPDRVYSTWIAANCLKRISNQYEQRIDKELLNEIYTAIDESHSWIVSSRNADGGWSPLENDISTLTSSAIALISIFSQGVNPQEYIDSFNFINKTANGFLWELEREIVVTQEGYELTQEWFTSVYCFRAFIFFAELGICSLAQLHSTYTELISLIEHGKVRPTKEGSLDLIWTIPFMIESLDKFNHFVTLKRKEYDDFLYQKEIEEKKEKKNEMERVLKNLFPFPISQVYFSFSHELDYHRRFQYLIQLYEVLIKFTTVVGLSASIASNEKIPQLQAIIESRFKRPSLGDWVGILDIILNNSVKVYSITQPWSKDELLKKQINFIDHEAPRQNLNQTLAEIVSLRNSWTGHGAVRSVYEYKMEIEKQIPLLFTLFNRLMFLAKCNSFLILSSEYNEFGDGDIYKIRVFNGLDIIDNDLEVQKRLSEGQKDQLIRYVYFHNMDSNTIINLYPFLSYMVCPTCKKERFFFFNSAKNAESSTYLSFECGHTIEYNNMNHFVKRFAAAGINF